MPNFTFSLSRVLAVLAVSASIVWVQAASAQSVAENIKPVAQVCLSGQSCVGSQSGSPVTAAPVAAAIETVAEVVEEVTAVVAAVATESNFDAAAKYQLSCFACHGTGAAGAPKLDDTAQWETRMAKGMDAVMANVINGINTMPPKGLCFDCSDSDLVALVEYMTSQ